MRHVNLDLQASHKILLLLDDATRNTEKVVDLIPGAFLIINEAHEILRANHAFVQIVGMSSDALFRIPLASFFSSDGWSAFVDNMNRIAKPSAAERIVKFDVALSTEENSGTDCPKDEIPFHWNITRLNVSNKGEGQLFSVFGQDMSAMQYVVEQAEALQSALGELGKVIENLHRTQDELVRSEKLASLGSMVAGIAHELNTPIGNSLMVASHLVKTSKKLAESVKTGLKRSMLDEFLADSDSAGDVLVRSLNKAAELVSSFKQVAVDQTSAQRREFKLADTVGEIVTMLLPALRETPYVIEQAIPDEIVLDSFPGSLGQALTNIINNAVHHGFDGRNHGRIVISALLGEDGKTVVLKVIDDGKGMAESVLPYIFDPFFTTNRGVGGSGLGLNIAHNIVSGILGGRISAESELGKGATFTLVLALNAPVTATNQIQAAS